MPASERRRRLRSQHVFTPAPAAARALFFGPAFHVLPLLRFSAQIQSATGSCFRTATSVEQQIMHRAVIVLRDLHGQTAHDSASKAPDSFAQLSPPHSFHARYPRHTEHAIPAYPATLPSVNPFCCLAPLHDGTTRNSLGTQRHFEFANTANLLLGLCSGTTFYARSSSARIQHTRRSFDIRWHEEQPA